MHGIVTVEKMRGGGIRFQENILPTYKEKYFTNVYGEVGSD